MKKFIAILGAIAFLSFLGTASLTACKKKEEAPATTEAPPAPPAEQAPAPAEAPPAPAPAPAPEQVPAPAATGT